MTRVVGAIEIGGSHVSAGRVDVKGARVVAPGVKRSDVPPRAGRDELLDVLAQTARSVADADIEVWGVATPGPFDYDRGVSRIRGLGKLESLYGTDVRSSLARAVEVAPERVRFLNDAHAFGLGESRAGAARGHERAMCVTLGTGLGSAFLVHGDLVTTGPGLPPAARLDLVPFRGGTAEDVISARGIRASYGEGVDVAEIARRARGGERRASDALRGFGSALGELLEPWIESFLPDALVFGGRVARAWDLFGDALVASSRRAARLERCGPAELLEEAPLIGAALYAEDSPG